MWKPALASGILAIMGAAAGMAQDEEAPLAAPCQQLFEGDFSEEILQQCADASDRGSPPWRLSKMNLATLAANTENPEGAAAIYDELDNLDGQTLTDPYFHITKMMTYERLGRKDEASQEAVLIARMYRSTIRGDDTPPAEEMNTLARAWTDDPNKIQFIAMTMDPLERAGDEEALQAMREVSGNLSFQDEFEAANLLYIWDELDMAKAQSAEVTRIADRYPSNPMILNNVCYIMVRQGEAERYLGRCRRAATLVPEISAVQHSLYAAYATLGRCEEARETYDLAVSLRPEDEEPFSPFMCPKTPEQVVD